MKQAHHRERHARPTLPTAPAPRAYRATDRPSPEAIRAAALVLFARLACAESGVDPDGAPSYVETLIDRNPLE